MHPLQVLPALFVLSVCIGLAPPALGTELDDTLADFLEESGLTGISLAVAQWDDLETASAGTLDLDGGVAVTDRTRFYVASCGKSVVAAAILAYVADGRLDLEARVWPLISDIAGIEGVENADKVTLRQLLDHTSGLSDYLDDAFNDMAVAAGAEGVGVEQAIAAASTYPAFFAPGAGSEYSNTNYLLLGHILAGLAGSLDSALADKVIDPAHMSLTSVGIGADTSNAARGYGEDGADFTPMAWASTFGDGPLVSTPTDLVRFSQALFRDGALLPASLVKDMTTGTERDPSYGLGMGVDSDEWGGWYGHTGGVDGYEAEFRYYPEHDLAIAYAANGTSYSEDAVLDLVVQRILRGE